MVVIIHHFLIYHYYYFFSLSLPIPSYHVYILKYMCRIEKSGATTCDPPKDKFDMFCHGGRWMERCNMGCRTEGSRVQAANSRAWCASPATHFFRSDSTLGKSIQVPSSLAGYVWPESPLYSPDFSFTAAMALDFWQLRPSMGESTITLRPSGKLLVHTKP